MPYSQFMGITRGAVGVVAGLGLVGLGYGGLAGEDNSTRDDAGQIVDGGEVGAFRIRVGDCYNEIDPNADVIQSVNGVHCSQPHDSEAYFAFNIPEGAGDYPGTSVVEDLADEGCYDAFQPFVGATYDTSKYGFYTIYPTVESWDQLDDREILCAVYNYDLSKKTGSAKNTGI